MPQLNPEFFVTQVFWLVATFETLYILLSTIALPRIGAILDERKRRIDEHLTKAEHARQKAESALQTREKHLDEAKAQASALWAETNDRLTKEAEARNKVLADKLAEKLKASEDRINEARALALAEVRQVALEVTAATIQRLTGHTIPQNDVENAVAEIMKGHA